MSIVSRSTKGYSFMVWKDIREYSNCEVLNYVLAKLKYSRSKTIRLFDSAPGIHIHELFSFNSITPNKIAKPKTVSDTVKD